MIIWGQPKSIRFLNHLVWFSAIGLASARLVAANGAVDFNRDVLPLLSDKCFACHGPDAKAVRGGLRLDLPARSTQPGKSGRIAIVPGRPEQSELVRRIRSSDPEEIMPPPESHKALSGVQKDLLRRWIKEGAEYRGHWAYQPPVKAPVPAGRHGVDYLVRRRWKEAGLRGSMVADVADRRTLARRLSFDLVGLPPKPETVETFLADRSPEAYERLVDRLLASPHYGERMALGWLDVVRFADTSGYHSDNPRNIWPYRDYVIGAFNENIRFDRFTREQLAGDMLPGSTQAQKVASGFNRLLLTTEEGGAQPRDYEARHLADRVRAVGTVWLAQTIGCAQCHDHKFDPFVARDFYALGAFFADVKEAAIGRRENGMLVIDEEQAQKLTELETRVARAQAELEKPRPDLENAFATWQTARLSDAATNFTIGQPAARPSPSKEDPKATEILKLLQVPPNLRDASQRDQLRRHFRETAPEFTALREQLTTARRAHGAFADNLPRTLVTERLESPRVVRVLPRGDWMSEAGEPIEPAWPAALRGSFQAPGRRLHRLDLANWLVAGENPLPARVFMNRLWKQFFGTGLAPTMEDFGTHGDPPSDPVLLDWLACEFVESGWDIKHMVRLLVTSATYRLSSTPTRTGLQRDSENRFWTRQGRWRLDAELVRDNALAVAGLLDLTVGGPSVMPYQPDGYWENLNFPKRSYEASAGPSQHRRGIYTWWQRSFPHPSLVAFDAPSREECVAERTRSNIPQQALILLNDPSYLEAAGALARRILREAQGDDAARITWAWRQTVARTPESGEITTLLELLQQHRNEYRLDELAASAYLKAARVVRSDLLDEPEWAAWINVARALLNLHETITRP